MALDWKKRVSIDEASDRLEAWVEDSGAICVIAVGSHGDPLDLSEHEVEQFIERLQDCLRHVRLCGSGK